MTEYTLTHIIIAAVVAGFLGFMIARHLYMGIVEMTVGELQITVSELESRCKNQGE